MENQRILNLEVINHLERPIEIEQRLRSSFDQGQMVLLEQRIIDEELARRMRGKEVSVEVSLVDDESISELNKLFRGKDGATDVLSFSYWEKMNFPDYDVLGEIAISVETAEKQSAGHDWKVEDEIEFLFVHGFLHLFGLDHETESDFAEMFGLHKKIQPEEIWTRMIERMRKEFGVGC